LARVKVARHHFPRWRKVPHNLKVVGSNPTPATNFLVSHFSINPMLYRVYVLRNSTGKFYIGLSEDVTRRLADHITGVSTWTKHKGPWSLVWTSEAMSLSESRKLENKIKRQGRGSGFYSITGIPRPSGS
jgi:putative endonuclease